MLSDAEITRFKALLEKQLTEAAEGIQAADTGTVTLDQSRVGRLSRMDALQQQAMASSLKERMQRGEKRIRAALARTNAGSYGKCCQCGDEISIERLNADPATPFCSDCQDEIEGKHS